MMKNKIYGFTLIELMVVISMIAILTLIALPRYWRFHAKAKRAEVYLNLSSLHTAEKLFWAEHGAYTDKLTGPDSLDWRPDGVTNYTYGFAGTENLNYLIGKLPQDQALLSKYARADGQGFTAVAIADIDGDGKFDVITIDEGRNFKIIQDDLQD